MGTPNAAHPVSIDNDRKFRLEMHRDGLDDCCDGLCSMLSIGCPSFFLYMTVTLSLFKFVD
jgi:hypothetical protein